MSMKSFKFLILFLIAFLTFANFIFGQTKKGKSAVKPAKPEVKKPQEQIQITAPPDVQAEPQIDKTPVKKNERPTDANPASENLTEPKKTNEKAKINSRENKEKADNPVYFYEFSQPNFLISKIVIEHDERGKGKITFVKREYDEEISDPIQLSAAALEKIKNAYAALNFLDSTENYQYEKDYTHLGSMKFTVRRDGRERTALFNWTENKDARVLADEYRKIGQQYIWIFDINLARENQPLNAPGLMDALAAYIRRDQISDAEQLIPFLKQLSDDERIPLIARNHAARLIKEIEKKTEKAQK